MSATGTPYVAFSWVVSFKLFIKVGVDNALISLIEIDITKISYKSRTRYHRLGQVLVCSIPGTRTP